MATAVPTRAHAVRGRTIRWTFADGPTAGTTFEHEFKHDGTVVFRTVGTQRYAALHDLKAIRLGAYRDPAIYANDVVVVGDSQARRIFRDVLQASGLLTTPLVALLQNNN